MVTGIGSVLLAYFVLRSRLGSADAGDPRRRGRSPRPRRQRVPNPLRDLDRSPRSGRRWPLARTTCSSCECSPSGTGGAFSVVLWTAPIIFIVVIGGIGTIEGPIIGAVLYYFLRDRFKDHQTVYLIAMGLVAMGVALWLQGGIWGTIRRRFGVDLFPVRRRLVDQTRRRFRTLAAVDPV